MPAPGPTGVFAVQCPNPKCPARFSIDEALLGKPAICRKCGLKFDLARGNVPAEAPSHRLKIHSRVRISIQPDRPPPRSEKTTATDSATP